LFFVGLFNNTINYLACLVLNEERMIFNGTGCGLFKMFLDGVPLCYDIAVWQLTTCSTIWCCGPEDSTSNHHHYQNLISCTQTKSTVSEFDKRD
jgi:hypothetical protein